MRVSAISLKAAVVASILTVSPAIGQSAEPAASGLRGSIAAADAAAPPASADTPQSPPATADAADKPALPEVDTIETGAADVVGPVAGVTNENQRVTPEPMVDTSDPPAFIAGNALRRTPDDDPYGAVGIPAGSFVLYPSIDLSTGYTSNATGSAGGSGAAFAIAAPELLIQSDWSRHAASLALRGSYQTFSNGAADVPEAEAVATTRLDLADRWNADLRAAYHYGRESLSNPDLPSGVQRAPDVNEFNGSASLSGAFGRKVFTVEAGADRSSYGDGTAGGKRVSQHDRDNTLYSGRVRLGYEVTRSFVPFVEGVLTDRQYDQRKDSDGIIRTSHGDGLRAGFTFDRSPVSSGEIAIGYLREVFDDNALKTLSAFTVDGSLLWSPTELTTITTSLSSSINPTTNPASSGSIVYDGGIDLAYEWRSNVTLGAAAGARYERFQGTHQVDWTYRLGFDATWQLNRSAALKAGYVHEWRQSSDRGNDYTDDTVRLDLTVRR
jgi:hypothetical protein